MRTDLRKKLGLYSLAAGAVAMGSEDSSAQVVYRDINPDGAASVGTNYMLDLNNDATNDFQFNFDDWGAGNAALYVSPLNNNAVLGQAGSGFSYQANVVNNGDAIMHVPTGTNQSWVGTAMMAVNGSTANYGPFKNATDKYVGLRLVVGTDTLYGWARVTVNITSNTITLKDVAYSTVHKGTIDAGSVTATKDPLLEKGTIVYVNDTKEVVVRRENEALQQNGRVEVLTMDGKLATSGTLTGNTTTLSMSEIPTGLVAVRISYDNAAVSRIVFVK